MAADDVYLSPDNWAAVVPVLIDLADHPDHVATNTDAGLRLRIPAYLAARYETYLTLRASEPAVQEEAPKRRGRPRKSASPDEESA